MSKIVFFFSMHQMGREQSFAHRSRTPLLTAFNVERPLSLRGFVAKVWPPHRKILALVKKPFPDPRMDAKGRRHPLSDSNGRAQSSATQTPTPSGFLFTRPIYRSTDMTESNSDSELIKCFAGPVEKGTGKMGEKVQDRQRLAKLCRARARANE